VIGEYERAFYGGQYASMTPLFAHYAIQLWMPEAGGPLGGGEDHEQLMRALGLQSKREITRTGPGSGSGPPWLPRPASRAATWAAARRTGYRLADAGPHPNKAYAAWGRWPTAPMCELRG
jgi:hypothetical protein